MIAFNSVVPDPLAENGLNPRSNVFNTEGVTFERGKRYLITAPSGKGKSTMMHIIYGLRQDFKGNATVQNKDVRTIGLDEWATLRQHHLSIVFQDLRLFPHLTGWENITLKHDLTNHAGKRHETPSVGDVENWAKRLGIAPFLKQKAETLSYGQRQRVAIIRALCQPFSMILLDEPFSHLDSENVKIASEIIEEACEKQKAGFIHVSLGEEYYFSYDEKLTL